MATYADLKQFGLALPGAEFFHLMAQPALRANGKTFALWWPPDRTTILKLEREHQVMLFEVRPDVFTPCKVGVGGVWSYVEIEKLGRSELKTLVTEAWVQVVPKKTSRGFFEGSRAS
ncbi:MAG TPA: MmcQ/YjbR family DNA-binding protein [Rhizomicrobium sp.]|nr:MmcQ/YjbR family DNA-binding protein [Rhizomicrobium sp.]